MSYGQSQERGSGFLPRGRHPAVFFKITQGEELRVLSTVWGGNCLAEEVFAWLCSQGFTRKVAAELPDPLCEVHAALQVLSGE